MTDPIKVVRKSRQKLQIGDFEIGPFDEKSVWICRPDGEGMQISIVKLHAWLERLSGKG